MPIRILFAIALFMASPGLAADFKPDRILLSSGGVAGISADIPVSGRTVVELDAPLAQMDDILKSLVVSGEEIGIVAVDVAGREPLSDTFANLPFTPADLRNSVTLLAALKGVSVEVRRNDRTLRGLVVGVEEMLVPEDPGTSARLAIATEAGAIEHVRIDEATGIAILDEAMHAAMLEALGAIAENRSAARRSIAITLDGPASGAATLSYVVGAPVWKPAWRIVLPEGEGTARFQGWAVLENRTGLEWDDVDLTLHSGTPVALTQTLYDSVTVPRPEVPLQVGQRLRPDMDRGVMAEASPPAPAPRGVAQSSMLNMLAGGMVADSAAMPKLATGPSVSATEALAGSTFRIPGTVDLAVGRSLTLPFFDGDATVTPISVFQPSVADRHPIAAVRVRNDSGVSLPGGIVTVFEGNGGALDFVGDAEFSGAAPGEERILAYALDAKVRIDLSSETQQSVRSARGRDGFLLVNHGSTRRSVYRLQGDPAAARTVLIQHPANRGWTVETDGTLEGRDGNVVRISVELGAGEHREVTVTESIVNAQEWSLVEIPDEIVLDILALGDALDDDLRASLHRIGDIRAEETQLKRALARIDDAIERIRIDQNRVRDNLSAVDPNGDLARTYIERLGRQEEQMATLETERDETVKGLEVIKTELAAMIAALGD